MSYKKNRIQAFKLRAVTFAKKMNKKTGNENRD